MLRQIIYVGDVIQIDDHVQFAGVFVLFALRHIGGEHNLIAREADSLSEHQFGLGSAVHAAALLPEDIQNIRIGIGFYGKIFPVAGVPGKSILEAARSLPETAFVIQVKRRGVDAGDLAEFFETDRHFRAHL